MSEKLIQFIEDEYIKRKNQNDRYSLRAYAQSIGMEHSALSKVFLRKRALTFEIAHRILKALKVQTPIRNSLLLSLADKDSFSQIRTDADYIILSEQELNKTYKWYFYATLSALEIKGIHSVVDVAKYLGLDIKTVQSTVKLLTRMGAIRTEAGRLVLTGYTYSTQNNVSSEALIKAHVDHMKMAIKSVTQKTPKTDFRGITVAIPTEKYEEAQRRIKEFSRALASWLTEDTHSKNEVYRINMQFFPLKQKTKK